MYLVGASRTVRTRRRCKPLDRNFDREAKRLTKTPSNARLGSCYYVIGPALAAARKRAAKSTVKTWFRQRTPKLALAIPSFLLLVAIGCALPKSCQQRNRSQTAGLVHSSSPRWQASEQCLPKGPYRSLCCSSLAFASAAVRGHVGDTSSRRQTGLPSRVVPPT